MSFLNRFNIGPRLFCGFACVLGLTVVVGVFSLNRLGKVNDATTDLATNWLPSVQALGEFQADLSELRNAEALYALSRKPEDDEALGKRVEATKERAAKSWAHYSTMITAGDEQKLAKAIADARDAYFAELSKSLALKHADAGFAEAAASLFNGSSQSAYAALSAAIQADVRLNGEGGQASYKGSEEAFSKT